MVMRVEIASTWHGACIRVTPSCFVVYVVELLWQVTMSFAERMNSMGPTERCVGIVGEVKYTKKRHMRWSTGRAIRRCHVDVGLGRV